MILKTPFAFNNKN